MKHFLLIFALFLSINAWSQGGFSASIGVGGNYSWGDLNNIQNSLASYFTYLDQQVGPDNYTAVDNWTANQLRPHFSAHLGYHLEGLVVGMGYSWVNFSQERVVRLDNGFGRQFNWQETRNEILVDFGWASPKLELFTLLGANISNYKMAVYQIYPDDTRSINNEYSFNGLFKQNDVGFSYGLGAKFKFMKRLAVDLRYLISSDKLLGEPEEALTMTDNSSGRDPATSELPADYTQALSFDNSIPVGVRRSFVKLTLFFKLIAEK